MLLLCPYLKGGAGCPSNTIRLGQDLVAYLCIKRHRDQSKPLGHNRYGPQFIRTQAWHCATLPGGTVSPSNTMWPGSRPTSISSGILVHPTVWPQYTNITNRQTDRHTDAQTERQTGQKSINRENRFTNGRSKSRQLSQTFTSLHRCSDTKLLKISSIVHDVGFIKIQFWNCGYRLEGQYMLSCKI